MPELVHYLKTDNFRDTKGNGWCRLRAPSFAKASAGNAGHRAGRAE